MPKWRSTVLLLIIPAATVAAYLLYLFAGGTLGRQTIKAQVSLRTLPHTHVIRPTDGGDCAELGRWSDSSATCTVTAPPPVGSSILITGDHVTLEGAGNEMTGSGEHTAVLIINGTGVTVRDLAVHSYGEGVLIQHSTGTRLTNLRIRQTSGAGIHLDGRADFNSITNNVIGPTSSSGFGIALWNSHGNLLAGNTIVGARDAIRLYSSDGNVVTSNLTTGSMIEGIDLHVSEGNTVVLNDLMEETAQPVVDDMPSGTNTYHLPTGGNHYRRFSLPEQGCSDQDSDGYCDAPYRFFREGADAKPSVRRWTDVNLSALGIRPEDIVAGRPYARCVGCHSDLASAGPDKEAPVAPDLRSVLGRPIASERGFPYSDALRRVGGVWTREALDRFLANPQVFAPGTKMIGVDVPDSTARRQIIDYLVTLSPGAYRMDSSSR